MLTDILEYVTGIDLEIRKRGSVAWYRGHRKSDWELKSTMHRHIERFISISKEKLSEEDKKDLLREEAKSLYRRFRSEAWPLLGSRERSPWGIMFTMQHYKLPTRLLDWSQSFGCALFFAQLRREQDDTAAIWIIDSEGLNETSLGKRGLIHLDDDDGPGVIDVQGYHPHWVQALNLPTIAVSTIITNPRMTAQRATFTLTGDSFESLEKQFDDNMLSKGIIHKIELPPETFHEIEDYLQLAGLSPFTYFPDLEGLALDHEARVSRSLRDIGKWQTEVGN